MANGSDSPDAARESRLDNRLQILGELKGEVMVFEPLALTEIAPNGAQVETAFPLQVDSLHDFRFTLGERSLVVKGRIVHCRISDVNHDVVRYRAGVEFVELTERVASVIRGFMADIRAGRRPSA